MHRLGKESDQAPVPSVSPVVQGVSITQAQSPPQIAQVRELFLEYAQSLGFSLCFQSFDQELAGLPGDYAPPDGRLLIMEYERQPAGCVALHKLEAGVCEMKRLYVRSAFRGKSLGRMLGERAIGKSRGRCWGGASHRQPARMGYDPLRLDTVEPVMKNAVALYRLLGFRDIA